MNTLAYNSKFKASTLCPHSFWRSLFRQKTAHFKGQNPSSTEQNPSLGPVNKTTKSHLNKYKPRAYCHILRYVEKEVQKALPVKAANPYRSYSIYRSSDIHITKTANKRSLTYLAYPRDVSRQLADEVFKVVLAVGKYPFSVKRITVFKSSRLRLRGKYDSPK